MEVLPAAGPSDGRDKVPKYLKKSSIIMEVEDNQSVNGDSTLLSQVPPTPSQIIHATNSVKYPSHIHYHRVHFH